MYTLEQTKNIWITSDHHFNHQNIIKYTNRPFDTVEEMDSELIYQWNLIIGGDNIVYHLGDLTMGYDAEKYLNQLNGHISILYNPEHHDKRWISHTKGINSTIAISKSQHAVRFSDTITTLKINIGKDHPLIVDLCHFPLSSWHGSYHGSVMFHGHTHGNSEQILNRVDVGVDTEPNYRPYQLFSLLQEYI